MVLSETIAYGSAKPELQSQSQQEQEESLKDLSLSPTSGQNSLMSLTLNEIQLKSGKTFGSMNMDEFLANLWSSDDNQLVPTSSTQNEPNNNNTGTMVNPEPAPLARQGSFSIPAPLCKKTVDEVWFEIQKDQPHNQKINNTGAQEPPDRQQTFGEMTLEDFLIKAGVVQEAPGTTLHQKILTSFQSNNSCLDASFGLGNLIGLGLSAHHQNVGNNLSEGNGFGAYPMFQSKGFVGESSNMDDMGEKNLGLMDLNAQQNKNKRILDSPQEVAVERRQRRMIKNRESAARSRARKQAYTVELELELDQLKEENAKLKQIVEEFEQKRKEKVMKRKPLTMPQKMVDRLRAIRRTASLSW